MKEHHVSIRELRTDFRGVKRKMEEHGEVVITDHGDPAYILKPLRKKAAKTSAPPDYYARLLQRQPRSLSEEETERFWEEERGGR
jgi:antitoxin (DNA-binding transcriptional repressor) of toxin-antitoxin stability system